MTEIILCIVILFLLLHNFSTQRSFLNHLKQLEDKLAKIDSGDKVDSPNDIKENPYRDIDDVPPTVINQNQ